MRRRVHRQSFGWLCRRGGMRLRAGYLDGSEEPVPDARWGYRLVRSSRRLQRQFQARANLYDDRLECFLGSTQLLTLRRGRPPETSGKPTTLVAPSDRHRQSVRRGNPGHRHHRQSGFKTPFQAILKELGKDVQIRFAYALRCRIHEYRSAGVTDCVYTTVLRCYSWLAPKLLIRPQNS